VVVAANWLKVTLNEQVAVLPTASVAVYTTVVVPVPTAVPGEKLEVRVGVPQLSPAVGAVHTAVVEQVIKLCGQPLITGGWLSTTCTLKLQLLLLPFPSLVLNVTVVVPTPFNVVPAAGNWVKAGVPQLSAMVAGL